MTDAASETAPAGSISRRQLYDLVWQTPLRQLSPRYARSDVGLAKLCRRPKVPIRYRGYWARVAAGRAAARIPLPKGEDRSIHLTPVPPKPEPPKDPEVDAAVAWYATFSADDVVATDIESHHPLVRKLKGQLWR